VSGSEGEYQLTVNGAGITDLAGNPVRGSATSSWRLDLGKPLDPTRLAITPDLGRSSSDALTSTQRVAFTGSVAESNLTVRLFDISTKADLGVALMNGTNFSKALELTAGAHRIRAHASDGAANVSGDVFLNVFVDLVGPGAALQEIDTLRSNALNTIDVTFNEEINATSFTKADFTLTREGVALALPASAQVLFVSSNTYRLNGLASATDLAGLFTISLDLKGIEDLAGNKGATNIQQTWRRLGANTPPVLAAISSKVVGAESLLVFTNKAADADIPRNQLRFSLDAGAAAGATINPTNGVFSWRPTRAQAAQTFHVAVRVTDDGSPALSDVKSFTIEVTDYVDLRIGQTVTLSGSRNSLPVDVFTSAALTNLSFNVTIPTNRLANISVEGWVAEVGDARLIKVNDTTYNIRITSAPGKVFQGQQTLAQINFTAEGSTRSTFVRVIPSDLQARKADASLVATTYLQRGRVVILHAEPLLEAEFGTGGSRKIHLFGRADGSYRLQSANRLALNTPATWTNNDLLEVDPVTLTQEATLSAPAGSIFYRVVKASPTPLLPPADALLSQ
jgi:hypothetical protein